MAEKVKATLMLDVEYDPDITDAEQIAMGLNVMLGIAFSTPGILDECGNPDVGAFYTFRQANTRD